jgi:hypothetical protein
LTFPEGVARANVSLSGQSRVNVAAGGDGFINVNARNLTVSEGSRLFGGIAENMGSSEAQAGDLIINATDSLTSSRHRRWGIPKSFAIAEVLGSASPL